MREDGAALIDIRNRKDVGRSCLSAVFRERGSAHAGAMIAAVADQLLPLMSILSYDPDE